MITYCSMIWEFYSSYSSDTKISNSIVTLSLNHTKWETQRKTLYWIDLPGRKKASLTCFLQVHGGVGMERRFKFSLSHIAHTSPKITDLFIFLRRSNGKKEKTSWFVLISLWWRMCYFSTLFVQLYYNQHTRCWCHIWDGLYVHESFYCYLDVLLFENSLT